MKDAIEATLAVIREENEARNWGWYFSADEELYYGPYLTRDDAIATGAEMFERYAVAECHQGIMNVAVFSNLAEMIDDANADLSEEDKYPTESITDAQWHELEAELSAVAIRWSARHNLKNAVFDQMRNETKHEPKK